VHGVAEFRAKGGFICGLVSLLAWILPLAGLAVTIVGLMASRTGLKSHKHNLAVAGVLLNTLGLVLTIGNMALAFIDSYQRHFG
jgi:hypothetical protein